MNRFATTMALASCLAGACTTTRQVRRPASGAELESLMPSQRGRVTLLGEPSAADPAPSFHQVPALVERPLPPAGAVPLIDVSKLRGYDVKNRGRGALEGLGLGIVLGALVGAAVGSAAGSDAPCDGRDGCYDGFSASDKALAVGLIGALAGSIIGPLVGFAAGHTNRYVFTDGTAGP
ncbi:MAG TPA: hypothetical protein VIF57_05650 [Polyangia bacterium]